MTEQNDQNPTPSDDQQIYVPLQKKETIKVWTLTIILHLIIALALIAYWKFYHKPEPQHTPTTNKQPIEPMEATPVKTPAIIASIVASTTLASTTLASTAKPTTASQPKPITQTNGKPQQPNTATVPNATGKTPTPIPSSKAMPAPMPIPTPMPTQQTTTTTTTITKKEVYEAPVTQALTDRDLPSSEKPKNSVATAEKSKEANELSEDIDAKNKELSNLINQVRKQNQQRIDKEIKQPLQAPTENTQPVEKTPKLATSENDNKTEKVETNETEQ